MGYLAISVNPPVGPNNSVPPSHHEGLAGNTVYHRSSERSDVRLFQTEQSLAVVRTSRHGL